MTSNIVLYVAVDKNDNNDLCKGSRLCMNLLEILPTNFINVQSCDKLKSKNIEFPNWLNGTPTLVNRESGEIYKGSYAVQLLREYVDQYSKSNVLQSHNQDNSDNNNDNNDNNSKKYINNDDDSEITTMMIITTHGPII